MTKLQSNHQNPAEVKDETAPSGAFLQSEHPMPTQVRHYQEVAHVARSLAFYGFLGQLRDYSAASRRNAAASFCESPAGNQVVCATSTSPNASRTTSAVKNAPLSEA